MSALSDRDEGRMSCTTLKPLGSLRASVTQLLRYPPTIQPALRFLNSVVAEATTPLASVFGPPKRSMTRWTPRALGTFSAWMVKVSLPLTEFLKSSFWPVVGTGPRTSAAWGSRERMYLPRRNASSQAIMGESMAKRLPVPQSFTAALSPASASSIAWAYAVSIWLAYCVRRAERRRFSSYIGLKE